MFKYVVYLLKLEEHGDKQVSSYCTGGLFLNNELLVPFGECQCGITGTVNWWVYVISNSNYSFASGKRLAPKELESC